MNKQPNKEPFSKPSEGGSDSSVRPDGNGEKTLPDYSAMSDEERFDTTGIVLTDEELNSPGSARLYDIPTLGARRAILGDTIKYELGDE